MWTNSINGKCYIGSSENLKIRFLQYFNTNHLLKNKCMTICCALLKHGYSNFSLTILEYCEPSNCLIREKYYLDLLNPQYNISKEPAAPFSGRKHSDESRTIMSEAKKGENNIMYGKNHTEETKQTISDVMVGNTNGFKKGESRAKGSGRSSQVIEVTDITNNTTISYDSISEAARALNCNISSILKNLKSNSKKPYKGRYIFTKK